MSLPNPIVLLDARARYVHPAFQMTRASTKTVFDSAGRLVTVPANALGWDHDPATGQARGYLVEPQATNLLTHSNDLTQRAWSNKVEVTITGDAITGPDGNGMDKIVASAVNGIHHVGRPISHSSAGTVSISFLCAPGELTGVFIEVIQTEDNTHVWYTLEGDGGAEVAHGTPVDYGITRVGDFYRVWLVYQTADSSNVFRIGLLSGGSRTFAGDGTSGVYVGCVQAEAGARPTSYIETGGATATRAGDKLVLPDLSIFPWWDNGQGTVLLDINIADFDSASNSPYPLDFNTNLRFQRGAGNYLILTGGSLNSSATVVTAPVRGHYLLAMAWDGNNAIAASSGSLSSEVMQTGSIPFNTGLGLGVNFAGSISRQTHSRIRRAVYYPQRLSNADLQSLTAIQE